MQTLIYPVVGPRTVSQTGAQREVELIERRIASARKWQARRRILRLRALVFGRRKARRISRDVTKREVCAGRVARLT